VGLECWPAPLTDGIHRERRLGRDVLAYAGRPAGLTAMLDRAAEVAPDREAVVEGGTRLSWGEFRRQVHGLAGGLRRLGVGRGDRVATLLPNGIPFCLAVFAAAELGAVAVPLNTKLKRAELAFMLADSAPRALLADPAFYGEVAAVRNELPESHHVV